LAVDSSAAAAVAWAKLALDQVAARLAVDPDTGLDDDEVKQRLDRFGPNRLKEQAARTFWQMLLDQFKEVLVLILIAAAAVSGFLGEWADVAVIMIIVVLNAILGAVQENRAEQSLAALKQLSSPVATVVRGGQRREVPAAELVPGDVVLLEAGDYVPADLYLAEAANLMVDESTLTGESLPVQKRAVSLQGEAEGIGDLHSLAFSGTVATYGRGSGIVYATGMDTALGRIAGLLQQEQNEPTPLQRRMAEAGKKLGLAAGILVLVVFVSGVLRGLDVLNMFLIAVSLAVAAIPEGLPAIVTVVLALGVQRMARHRAIIRRLPAVETLGTATVIATDKTGTLTQNQMTVTRIAAGEQVVRVTGEGYMTEGEFVTYDEGERVSPKHEPSLALTLLAGVMANDAALAREIEGIAGDPTEGALVVAAAKAGLRQEQLQVQLPREAELPFDSERKLMTTLHRVEEPPNLSLPVELEEGDYISFTKGAPDVVLGRATAVVKDGRIIPLGEDERQRFAAANSGMAGEALRVLAMAVKVWPGKPAALSQEEGEQGLVLAGLVGMIDPPRPEAKESVEAARRAGITTVMVTGDYRDTAVAIAQELNIWEQGAEVLTGAQLEKLTDSELASRVDRIRVYARVAPEHKLRIVKAFKEKGEVVAVTGDGVNDSPALKGADIGAAMGITGTDVAKGAADMVLADDNFATIVAAVKEGRVIYANIRKAIHYLLSCNVGEIAAIFTAIILGLNSPLTAIQILWVNLVTDGPPALAMGVDPPEPGVMDQPPRKMDEGVFAGGLWQEMLWQGVFIGLLTLGVYAWGQANFGHTVGGSMAFGTLAFSQLFHSFNTRSRRRSLFEIGLTSNRYHLMAAAGSALLLLAVFFVPAVRPYFKLTALSSSQWLIMLASSFVIIPAVEIVKFFRARFAR